MAFEVYTKGSNTPRSTPVVTVQKNGTISVNDAGYRALGSPRFVQLLHDADEQLIALRATDETDLHGHRVRRAKDSGPVLVSAGTFARDCGIDTTTARRWSSQVREDMLVIDLATEGAVVVSNRERGRLARHSHTENAPAGRSGDAVRGTSDE